MDLSPYAKTIGFYDLFKGLGPEVAQYVFNASTLLELDPGDILIEPGVPNENLYLLLDGKLEVILEKDDTQIPIPISPGECLGEMSLIMRRPTSAMARAGEASKVLLIPGEVFWQKMTVTRQGIRNLMDMMARRLQRTNLALIQGVEKELKYQHLEKELATAGKIQANMVPDGAGLFPNRPEVEAYGMIQQARIVGGDFFDALALDHEHIYFAIGDVSGKGMPASLLMARTFTSLRHHVSDNPDFGVVFSTVNRLLCRNNRDLMFVSAFGGVLNVRTGLLQFTNAGHNPPIAALDGASEYRSMDLPHGTILGILEDGRYQLGKVRLKAGDTLVLYTDGLSEATRQDKEMFGEKRAIKYLNQARPSRMEDLVKGLERRVNEFLDGASLNDDITILALKYKG